MAQHLSPLFSEAMSFAACVHHDQYRKGTQVPYISHLLAVCSIVLEYGGNETEAIAALLHDAVEDQGGKEMLSEIQAKFDKAVAEIVAGCTDSWTEPKPDWWPRKEAYIEHLSEATPSTLLVSAADKLHNLRAILSDYRELGEALWDRFTGEREGTLWYYGALIEKYRQTAVNYRLVAELDRVYRELKLLAKAD